MPENVSLREEAAARCTKKIKRQVLKKQARKARGEHLVKCCLEPGKKKVKRKPLTFGERISTLKRRDTLLSSCRTMCLPNSAQRMLGRKLRKALYGIRPAAASWGDELRNGLVSCSLTVGTVSRCCFHNELCSVADDIFVAGPRRDFAKMGRHSRKDGRHVIR